MVPSVVWLQSDLCSICWTVEFELLEVVWTILDLEQEFWIIWETKVFTFHTFIQVRFWDITMQILYGFFRVKPENIGFATCMKNIGLRFASSNIFHTCSSSNIFRYHPQAIQYCIKLGMWVVVDTSTTIVVCRHQMCIFNTSFAYQFWLANNKKAKIPRSVWATVTKRGMWVVVVGIRITHVCLSSPNANI